MMRRAFIAFVMAACPIALGGGADDVDPGWLDRSVDEDRGCLERLIGYAPPEFPPDVQWIGSDPLDWTALRGTVVVVQSWTIRTAAGRRWAAGAVRALEPFGDRPVQMIALHTPDGADKAPEFLQRRPLDVPVVVDGTGALCDRLGVYERPANIVIDCNGVVRYVGLNRKGLASAVEHLLQEPPRQDAPPPQLPQQPQAAPPRWPAHASVRRALDLQGREGPDLAVDRWLNGRPDAEGKVVVLDFWATWCGPCLRSIPHMNELAETFRDDVVCIGLSDEDPAAFARGLQRRNLNPDSFRYHLALDPGKRVSRQVRVRAIPHVLVMSSDWTVRWQGHPARLTEQMLAQIVAANKAALEPDAGPACDRWQERN